MKHGIIKEVNQKIQCQEWPYRKARWYLISKLQHNFVGFGCSKIYRKEEGKVYNDFITKSEFFLLIPNIRNKENKMFKAREEPDGFYKLNFEKTAN